MKKKMMLLAAAVLLLSGCNLTFNQRQVARERTFTAAVKSATVLTEAGAFSDDDLKNVRGLILRGDRLMDRLAAANELGQATGIILDEFELILLDLVAQRIRAERKVRNVE